MKLYSEVDIKLISKPDEIYNIIGIHGYSDNILKAAFGCKDVKVDNYMLKYEGTYLTGITKTIFECDIDLEKRKVIKYNLAFIGSSELNVLDYDAVFNLFNDYFNMNEIDFDVIIEIKDFKFM